MLNDCIDTLQSCDKTCKATLCLLQIKRVLNVISNKTIVASAAVLNNPSGLVQVSWDS